MPETIYLPINVVSNRVLNADETTIKRRIDLIQGENYDVYLKFLSGASGLTPDIGAFSFILRSPSPNSIDLLTGDSFQTGSGAYPWKFSFDLSSPPLNNYISGYDYRDIYAQMVWTGGTGELEVIAPVPTRVTAASTELTGNVSYVASINGKEGAVTLAGGGIVSLSQVGNLFTFSASNPDLSSYATNAALLATGAAAQAQISNLASHTGEYYPRSNPSGYITGVDLSSYATNSALAAVSSALAVTGANLQVEISALTLATGNFATTSQLSQTGAALSASIANLAAATGEYYPRTNPSGFLTGVDLSPYATNAALSSASGTLQTQITANVANIGMTGATLAAQIATLNGLTGGYYPRSNPSGFITGVDLSPYSTTSALVAASGALQGQISSLSGGTGGFYPRTNPSGYISSIPNDVVRTTGNQLISGNKTFIFPDTFRVAADGATGVNLLEITSDGFTYIRNAAGHALVNTEETMLVDATNVPSILWTSRYLLDTGETGSVNYGDRWLADTAGNVSLNWATKQLTGNWFTNTVPTLTGHIINKGYFDTQTGLLASVANLAATGAGLQSSVNTLLATTGNYYLNSNPSAYITSNNVVFTNTAQTISGQKTYTLPIVFSSTGNSIGISGNGGLVDMAGGALRNSLQQTTVDWGIRRLYIPNGSTSTITVDWSACTLATPSGTTFSWTGLQLSGNWSTNTTPTLGQHIINKSYFDTQTGTLTGNFYPSSSNPSGYLVSSDLLPYATVFNLSSTGAGLQASIVTLQAATGGYYPSSNPSGYVGAAALTGYVATTGNQDIYGNKRFLGQIMAGVIRATGTDAGGESSIEVQSRTLLDSEGDETLYWNTRQLTGNWSTNTSPTVSGHLVNKGYLDSQKVGYTLLFGHAGTNPADATTHYWGNIPELASSATQANMPKVYVPRAGTIKSFMGACQVGGTIGTSETATICLLKNGTNIASGTMAYNDANRVNVIKVSGLNVSVAFNDDLQMQAIYPTWSTNPTTVRHGINVYIE